MKMNHKNFSFVFFGTPRFAALVLEPLLREGFYPSVIICNPDRIAGRKRILTKPAVKILGEARKIKIWQPESLSVADFKKEVGEIDFAVVAAYAKIIPQNILSLPRLGTIGVHPSLLPKYRGASPIQSAILGGEQSTGVTLYLMDEKVDHGSTLANGKLSLYERSPEGRQIANSDTYQMLEENLAKLGGELLAKTIPDFVAGKIVPKEQNHSEATFTKKFVTADGEVDVTKDDPEMIYRKIRALNPEPGVYTFTYPKYEGKRVKLLAAKFEEGKLRITEIQVEGRKAQRI